MWLTAPVGVPTPLIRQIIVLYNAGNHSVKGLKEWAMNNGLRGKRGGRIQASTFHGILRNPVYAGEFYWAGRLYRGKHPTIMSREQWERVQDRLDGHPYTRLIDNAHEDKLEGRTNAAFFQQKRNEWEEERAAAMRQTGWMTRWRRRT